MFEGMIVLGENLNATRKVKAVGNPKIVPLDGGRQGYSYPKPGGGEGHLDVTEILESAIVKKSGKLPMIAAGIINRDEEYVVAVAQQQIAAGADILDCCVDEISTVSSERADHMRWLVTTLQKHVRLPLSFDSSDPVVLRAGLEVYDGSVGKGLINSVNLEPGRLPILALAAELKVQLLGNASGETDLPSDAEGRVANLTRLWDLMDKAGIAVEDRTLDPLVLPVATDTRYPGHFLEACAALRAKFGTGWHLTGGLSNVSFGLPNRRTVNEAMCYLSKASGCDMAFIDPLQVKSFRPNDEDFKLAVAALKGEDEYCMDYIQYAKKQKI